MSSSARALNLTYAYQEWPMRKVFRISREAKDSSPVFVVHLSDGEHVGRGECGQLRHYGETRESIAAQFDVLRGLLQQGLTAEQLNATFPAGSARNAVDCALWDLACKRSGQSIWQMAGVAPKAAQEIAFTIGIGTLDEVRRSALELRGEGYRMIKVKVDAQRVIETLSAVVEMAPDARLIVDPNEAWSIAQLRELAEPLTKLNVAMIEQPLHRRDDHLLESFDSPIPLYADESFATTADLDRVARLYDGVNIKLDKCGGLSEALKIVAAAQERRMGLMIGCSGGSSLGLAPAYVVGTFCSFRDLDSAGLHYDDRRHAMPYLQGSIHCFTPPLWG